MNLYHDPSAWDELIELAEIGKAYTRLGSQTQEEMLAYQRKIYRAIHRLLKRKENAYDLGYNWGIEGLNVSLEVKIAAWRDGDVVSDSDINELHVSGPKLDYRERLRNLGFTDDEIDDFLSDD